MGHNRFLNKGFYGIKVKEVVTLLSFYLVFSFFYKIILMLNRRGYSNYKVENDVWYNFAQWFRDGGLQYIIMFIIAFFIWVLIFKILKEWSLWKRLLIHVITLPAFVWIAQQGYYALCDLIDIGYLKGSGQVWDIFIPSLVYLIQFSMLHAYEYYIVNQQKLREEIELKNSVLKNELSALKAQLNPHFLYNVFNTINASVPVQMEETREMIASLSDLFRYQLKASQEDEVSLSDELEFIKQYLLLEQKRFENRLDIQFDVPEKLLGKKIPPMLLQPIVENSVKHGIAPLIDGGRIVIKVTEQGDHLSFEISDTGVGIKDKKEIFKKGIGLGNTQMRLQKMYGSTLSLKDNVPKGLIVNFTL